MVHFSKTLHSYAFWRKKHCFSKKTHCNNLSDSLRVIYSRSTPHLRQSLSTHFLAAFFILGCSGVVYGNTTSSNQESSHHQEDDLFISFSDNDVPSHQISAFDTATELKISISSIDKEASHPEEVHEGSLTPSDPPFARDNPLAEYIFQTFSTASQSSPPVKTNKEKRFIRLHADVMAFYAQNAYRPLWITPEATLSETAQKLSAFLTQAEKDGLNSRDYLIPEIHSDMPLQQQAEIDIALSLAIIRYAQDARGGRLEPSRISSAMTPKLELPDSLSVFEKLANTDDPVKILADFHPKHTGYLALKKKLNELQNDTLSETPKLIPEGVTLKIGMSDQRVPLIRERLKVAAPHNTEDHILYSQEIAEAVKTFQRSHKIRPSGLLTPATLRAMNNPPRPNLEADIIANMERWRWLPSSLGSQHIFVNIPEYKLRLINDGISERETRVIVGAPSSPTPVFSNTLQFLVVNPFWTIPPSILKNEVLPGLAKDPSYAARRGYEVSRRGNRISVRQPPGPRNALGYIKFMFPNDHAVYLHDTPNRGLFSAEQRARSHGCVRVEHPFQLAELLLKKETDWTEAKLRSLIGRGERNIPLKDPIPIHLVYFTMAVDETGNILKYSDIYGFHRKTSLALGL